MTTTTTTTSTTTTSTTTTTNPFFPELAMYVWGDIGRSQYIGRPRLWVNADAAERWSPESYFDATDRGIGQFPICVAIRGDFEGTVVLQRSYDDGLTWHTVAEYEEPIETHVVNPDPSFKYRIGIDADGYSSGEAICILSQ